jgi:hypothetical protein
MEFITTIQDQDYAVSTILNVCNNDAFERGNLSEAYVERDGDGNVISLVDLGQERSTTTGKDTEPIYHWAMPAAIGQLTHLKKLAVYNCISLPVEIGQLTELQELSLHFCSQMVSLPTRELGYLYNLKDIRIHGDTSMVRLIPYIESIPNLRYFYYRSVNGEDRCMLRQNLILDLLQPTVEFKATLEILDIEGGDLIEDDVTDIFLKVLPQYPKLQHIFIPKNLIRSLTPIVKVLPDPIPSTIRLKRLNLLGNPIHSLLDSNDTNQIEEEQQNLLKLITLHEELTSVGRGITESALCTTQTLLMLDLNDGGRVLLSERFRPIPLSVWPTVLERANQLQGYHDNSNVIYHLLRYGPAWGKRDMHYGTLNGKKRKVGGL